MAKEFKLANKIINNNSFEAVVEKFPVGGRIIAKLQKRELGKKEKGRRYTNEEKIMFLSLYKSSPKAYRNYSNMMRVIPAPITLNK